MNNEFLNKKLSQLVNDKTQVIKASRNYSKGQVVSFGGNSFISQHEVRKGSDLLLTEEGQAISLNSGGVDQGRVISSTTLTSRSGSPRPRARGGVTYQNFFGISPFTEAFPDIAIVFNNRYPSIKLRVSNSDQSSILTSKLWLKNGKLYAVTFYSDYSGNYGYYSFQENKNRWSRTPVNFSIDARHFNSIHTNSSYMSFASLNGPGFLFDLETGDIEPLNLSISNDLVSKSFSISGVIPTTISRVLPELPFNLSSTKTTSPGLEEATSTGNYSFPMLVNEENKKFICNSFNGTTTFESAQNPVPLEPQIVTMTNSSTVSKTQLFSDGTYSDTIHKTQYMVHMTEEATGNLEVGSTISETFSTDYSRGDSSNGDIRKSQYFRIPANLLKVTGDTLNDYTIDSEAFSELNSLASAGSNVYGAYRRYEGPPPNNNYTIVIFKGVLNSLNYQMIPKNSEVRLVSFTTERGLLFCPVGITGYSFTVTEIIREFDSSDLNLEFNEQFYPTSLHLLNSGRKLGKFFLDGSFSNIFSSYYFTGPNSLAVSANRVSYDNLLGVDFYKYLEGNKWIWKDPFIYRVTMYIDKVALTGEYQLDNREVSFFRWKINYATSPIRFEFDGIENFNLREVSSDILSNINENNLNTCTDATF